MNRLINPWRMLFVLLLLQIVVALLGRSISPLGVLIGEDLNLTKAQIGMLPAAFFVGQSFNSIPAGLITDRVGTRKMIIGITILIGSSFILVSVTNIFIILLLLLFLGGAGYGAMHPASNRGVLYWFNKEQLGLAMGIKQTGVTVGSALSALILLPLSNEFGWRTIVLVTSILLIAYGVMASRLYVEPSNSIGNTKDIKNFMQSLLSVLKHKALILISFCAMGLSAGQMMLNTYIVLFAYEKLGYTLFLAGLLLVISEVFGSLGRILWGMISDKYLYSNRIIVLITISTVAGCLAIILSLLGEGFPYVLITLIVGVLGFCISGFNGIWMNAATELVPKEQSGASSGISIMLGTMGVLIGPPIFGVITDYSSYSLGWVYFSVIMFLVTILLLFTRYGVEEEGTRT
ncbi:MFS transporter [Piscibacillus halophilus]|uniref:Sugar phosphate permease n=1 Tax=Piscibacillus halophilus TaxID=571933 RepID=A0A1H9I7T2_9BACI|nr:MFS transporter [Piscibacillus halophilus]SEQ70622.1 Sugar phosphate permease [Piscibacillus halophilus]